MVAELSERITRQHARAQGFATRAGVLMATLGVFSVGLYSVARYCPDPHQWLAALGLGFAVVSAVLSALLLYTNLPESGPPPSKLAEAGDKKTQDAAIAAMAAAIRENDARLSNAYRMFRVAVSFALAAAIIGALLVVLLVVLRGPFPASC